LFFSIAATIWKFQHITAKLVCEPGAGSGEKESREQGLSQEIQKLKNSTKNRKFYRWFFFKV
jgi:hypothetical protein